MLTSSVFWVNEARKRWHKRKMIEGGGDLDGGRFEMV
jgi:hypothetical protein